MRKRKVWLHPRAHRRLFLTRRNENRERRYTHVHRQLKEFSTKTPGKPHFTVLHVQYGHMFHPENLRYDLKSTTWAKISFHKTNQPQERDSHHFHHRFELSCHKGCLWASRAHSFPRTAAPPLGLCICHNCDITILAHGLSHPYTLLRRLAPPLFAHITKGTQIFKRTIRRPLLTDQNAVRSGTIPP